MAEFSFKIGADSPQVTRRKPNKIFGRLQNIYENFAKPAITMIY